MDPFFGCARGQRSPVCARAPAHLLLRAQSVARTAVGPLQHVQPADSLAESAEEGEGGERGGDRNGGDEAL
eukprot:1514925-Prymnesium_polylepis.1